MSGTVISSITINLYDAVEEEWPSPDTMDQNRIIWLALSLVNSPADWCQAFYRRWFEFLVLEIH